MILMSSVSSQSSNEIFSALGWSAAVDDAPPELCKQTVPVDINRADSVFSLTESDIYWDLVVDRTVLDIGFDIECLDGLDDLLLLSPVDAFATVCWDAVIRPTPKPRRQPLSRPRPQRKSTVSFPRRRPPRLTLVKETSSEESGYESGCDELQTLKDEATPLQSPLSSLFPSPLPSPYDTGFHLNHQPTVEPITLIKYSLLPYEINTSFIIFEPQHTISYSEDGLGLSSLNIEQRKATAVNRIAAFCANLPNRLLRSSTQ
ncbi:hypothetical protein Agabi119p4_2224 [Agaricus bisporus var. burnettii]|uniref:Uncharacterized protein n=1 Tax=Agaricus bisporus var. burnettii TaxID=192524 RepID=A0A8H7F8T0_AGABI|nr:hypothetical protein AGABI2DRAFT_118344 [Agaricus bisporus var. bisporus H97]EKV47803.1 hypothetical protein AGABI2DRAFT_118344 [Agaricus bisporus var. bisporus H97]KAF7782848.1 hypothetical protein Agabi119p4_2224 [Agaricus bisporus var. burnettii]